MKNNEIVTKEYVVDDKEKNLKEKLSDYLSDFTANIGFGLDNQLNGFQWSYPNTRVSYMDFIEALLDHAQTKNLKISFNYSDYPLHVNFSSGVGSHENDSTVIEK